MTSTPWNGNLKGVGGLKQKCPPSGGMDIFWNYTLANKPDILSHKKILLFDNSHIGWFWDWKYLP